MTLFTNSSVTDYSFRPKIDSSKHPSNLISEVMEIQGITTPKMDMIRKTNGNKSHALENISISTQILSSKSNPKRLSKSSSIYKILTRKKWPELSSRISQNILDVKNQTFDNKQMLETIDALNKFKLQNKDDSYLMDIATTLDTYFRDIFVSLECSNPKDAILKFKRCKEILDEVQSLDEYYKELGIDPLQDSELKQIDVIDGKPIFTIND
ncbi:MAG: hypothetical protein KC444_03625 [Nitrosopumilus sp.]|nr:hypothetical protein [Nitrosopumilus sp.]